MFLGLCYRSALVLLPTSFDVLQTPPINPLGDRRGGMPEQLPGTLQTLRIAPRLGPSSANGSRTAVSSAPPPVACGSLYLAGDRLRRAKRCRPMTAPPCYALRIGKVVRHPGKFLQPQNALPSLPETLLTILMPQFTQVGVA